MTTTELQNRTPSRRPTPQEVAEEEKRLEDEKQSRLDDFRNAVVLEVPRREGSCAGGLKSCQETTNGN
jgi:hypothetical protein